MSMQQSPTHVSQMCVLPEVTVVLIVRCSSKQAAAAALVPQLPSQCIESFSLTCEHA